jgi:hypothetical protein
MVPTEGLQGKAGAGPFQDSKARHMPFFEGEFRKGKAHLIRLHPNRRLGHPYEVSRRQCGFLQARMGQICEDGLGVGIFQGFLGSW